MYGKEKIVRYFAGGNTPVGFYSYYNQVLAQDKANHIFCIKGGPGTGKSSFMRKIGYEMVEKGYNIEFIHCSSDPDSLDGVVIKDINIALFDATAPHIIDPINPGAVDEILNIGEYWDERLLKSNKSEIIRINSEIGNLFSRAYGYIKAAKCIYDETLEIYKEAIDVSAINRETQRVLIKELASRPIGKSVGKVRRLFASAITPKGLINYLNTFIDDSKKIYVIKSVHGVGSHILLSRIVDETLQRGISMDVYYCPMEPEYKIEHIAIPELELLILTSNAYHSLTVDSGSVIDLDNYIDNNIINKYKDVLDYNKTIFDELLNKAIETISNAKQKHDLLEQNYIPAMDFERIDEFREKILKKIMALS